MKNWKQFYAIEAQNKKRILAVNSNVPERSGIYILTRYEHGLKFAYIGQAKNLIQRLAGHLNGYQHIDLSIKKHGLYGKTHQLRNKTTGSQGKGKKDIADTERKGYNQGLANGYKKAQKEIAKLFEKNLKVEMQGTTNKLKERAIEKLEELKESKYVLEMNKSGLTTMVFKNEVNEKIDNIIKSLKGDN